MSSQSLKTYIVQKSNGCQLSLFHSALWCCNAASNWDCSPRQTHALPHNVNRHFGIRSCCAKTNACGILKTFLSVSVAALKTTQNVFLYHGHCTLQAKPCLNSAPHSTCPVGILKGFSHTHKNPNNGVLTKEYGYHKCGVLKNEQQINTGDMRLSQPLHVKASRVTQPTKQRPSSMNGNFKKCKSDGHTKKLGNWPSYLLLMIRKCKLNSILL